MAEAKIRVHRTIQMAGLASRRTAEAWVEAGRVTVNGVPAVVGQLVDPTVDKVGVDGQTIGQRSDYAYWMVNKPVGYTCSLKDRHAEHLVTELVPKGQGRLYPIGRLDRDSQGLILMTNDGSLAFKLSHPRYQIPKVYEVWVEGFPRRHRLDRIERGIQLDDGIARASHVSLIRTEGKKSLLRIVLSEGRKREIRRLMTTVGHPVITLTRVAYANLSLTGLDSGQARPLSHREVAGLTQLVTKPEDNPESPAKNSQSSKKSNRLRRPTERGSSGNASSHGSHRSGVEISARRSSHPVGQPRGNRGRTHR